MKAISQDRYGLADVLELTDVDRPAIGDSDVLVRVRAAGVSYGDWHTMTGTPYLVRAFLGLRRPRASVRGTDIAGYVEAVGAKVTGFAPGDEVFGWCTGGFAEYARAGQDSLVRVPDGVTLEQAAATPTSGMTALQGLHRAKLRAGQRVLVIGAGGGVGTFAVQIAKALGAEVTGVCSTAKVELVRGIGADHVIDYTREDFARDGQRYDVIFDIAGSRPLAQLRRSLTPGGTLVVAGGEGGGRWLGELRRSIRGALTSPFVRHRMPLFISMANRDDLVALAGLMESGAVRPVVDRIFPLSQTPDAVRYLVEGHAKGKVVVTV
jgi:NADPH:quinone reductase-like Zn-dependent oxidoreductase